MDGKFENYIDCIHSILHKIDYALYRNMYAKFWINIENTAKYWNLHLCNQVMSTVCCFFLSLSPCLYSSGLVFWMMGCISLRKGHDYSSTFCGRWWSAAWDIYPRCFCRILETSTQKILRHLCYKIDEQLDLYCSVCHVNYGIRTLYFKGTVRFMSNGRFSLTKVVDVHDCRKYYVCWQIKEIQGLESQVLWSLNIAGDHGSSVPLSCLHSI